MTSKITKTVVKSLFCYPVKSCKGIELEQAWLGPTGIVFDRQWMLVDKNGRFITQRKYPRMSLITTSLPLEILSGEWGSIPEDACLTVSAPDCDVLSIPLISQQSKKTSMTRCWEWSGLTEDEGDEAAEWFTKYLGVEVRLVRYCGNPNKSELTNDGKRRLTDPQFPPNTDVTFVDGYPIHLTTEASLEEFNNKAGISLPMNRFRPNIVVSNSTPFQEDEWEVGNCSDGMKLIFQIPCSRCSVTTVNQTDGQFMGKEPLSTLSSFRSGRVLGWSENEKYKHWKNDMFFGWNLANSREGIVTVGDVVEMHHRTRKFAS
eukprot:TRINITY_DN39768_c0_g1_i1.p1 TRINITY_DN39768_c0_g1~~TRINITY_DN39768_c0_g1_i1.p1  ORF type:complete len:348 (-),score=32.86 TRINITY_DN39768_c0_g1_i1:233-1183(-)